jgi:uncharacterized RDD family membrane protein YckC
MTFPPLTDLPDPERQSAFYEGVTVKRGIAWVLDTIAIGLVTLLVSAVTIVGLFIIPLIFLVVGFLYRWLTIASSSATPGMAMMAIEFRTARGERFDSGTAFLHTLGYTVSISIPLLQVASIVLMFVSERGQGLTDMVLGTVALNRRA